LSSNTPAPDLLRSAWSEAAADLEFEFLTPFAFVDGEGTSHSCTGLAVHFGCAMGTLITSDSAAEQAARRAGSTVGYYTSALNLRDFESYDRSRFIEALADFGYYGPVEKCPSWYAEARASILA
jgi:hypothetical protein